MGEGVDQKVFLFQVRDMTCACPLLLRYSPEDKHRGHHGFKRRVLGFLGRKRGKGTVVRCEFRALSLLSVKSVM